MILRVELFSKWFRFFLRTFTCNMHAFGLSRTLCLEFLRKQCVIANLTKGKFIFQYFKILKYSFSELHLKIREIWIRCPIICFKITMLWYITININIIIHILVYCVIANIWQVCIKLDAKIIWQQQCEISLIIFK